MQVWSLLRHGLRVRTSNTDRYLRGFEVHQLNVETVLLYVDLVEEVYVAIWLLGMKTHSYVWRLLKSLYGLKRSP